MWRPGTRLKAATPNERAYSVYKMSGYHSMRPDEIHRLRLYQTH
ncbi:hypothetical protein HDE79_001376 [Rhodanobacter sp. MP1X3]|nr:hypothetical protein [Rhodanobacter sp. MP1X3]